MYRYIYTLFLGLLTFFTILSAADSLLSQKEIKELGITQFTLENGMRVCLKQIPDAEGEIFLQLFAVGGLSAFPDTSFVSGNLSPDIALESGVGKMRNKDLARLLFEEWFDFSVKIQPYQRLIEAGFFAESLPHVLGLIHTLFVDVQFNEEGVKRVVEQMQDSITRRKLDCEAIFEDRYIAINTQNLKSLQPISVESLKKIDLQTAKSVFLRCFSIPSEFVCVIAGDFSNDQIIPFIIEHLASIPAPASPQKTLNDEGLGITFPKGISIHHVLCGNEEENNTRLTFPFKINLQDRKLYELEFATQIIETRLRNTIREKMGTTQGIDVGYEFPQYPHLNEVWLTIQFRSKKTDSKAITNFALSEIQKLRTNGPSVIEIEEVKLLLQRTDKFWAKEPSYWIATLSNYYKWNWDLTEIYQNRDKIEQISVEKISQLFLIGFQMDQYTVITRQSIEN